MKHLVLLGDSILDNGAYTGDGPDVATQLRALLAPEDKVTLLATDGDVTADIARQLQRLPADATHLILSVGGNDALSHADFLEQSAGSVAEVLLQLDSSPGSLCLRRDTDLSCLTRQICFNFAANLTC